MPISVRLEASGTFVNDRLIRDLTRYLPGALPARVYGEGLAAAARIVRDEARTIVPQPGRSRSRRSTGALRTSLRARRRAGRFRGRRVPGARAILLAGGLGRAPHAILTEKGWRSAHRTPAQNRQPYLIPALHRTVPQQTTAATRAIRRGFIRVATEIKSRNTGKLTRRLAGL